MIVIAFYVVPFITSWGRLLQEGTIERGASHYGVLFCFLFLFLSCFSCASFYYWCCYIPFEKCLLRIFFLYFVFTAFSWHFSLAFRAHSGAIGFNLSLLILNAIFN